MDDIVKPNICPECRNTFMQPFVCTTCGAQKLYDTTLMTAVLRAEKAEHEIERLRAECEALRKDAERYRWLRDIGDRTWTALANRRGFNAAAIDSAIDRAKASSAEGGSNDR